MLAVAGSACHDPVESLLAALLLCGGLGEGAAGGWGEGMKFASLPHAMRPPQGS